MSIETLRPLAERLKSATGPDRELDCDLQIAFDGFTRNSEGRLLNRVGSPAVRGCWPGYTASIDAALALVERLLPGHGITLEDFNLDGDSFCSLWPKNGWEPDWQMGHSSMADHPEQHGSGRSPTRPIAILRALVAALIAKNTEA